MLDKFLKWSYIICIGAIELFIIAGHGLAREDAARRRAFTRTSNEYEDFGYDDTYIPTSSPSKQDYDWVDERNHW